jgi:hypothetical protein
MKRIVFLAVMIFAVSLATFAGKFVAEGKTFSALGNYRIETADNPVMLNGKELKAFIISFENSKMNVTVASDKNKKGMTYYVLSDNLSVKYICNGEYFGVARLDKELEKDGYKTSDAALNRLEYFHQRVITADVNCDLDNLKLIAAYYPMLINDYENMLAAK